MKGQDMFKSRQYRAEAAEYGKRAKEAIDPDEGRKLQDAQDRLVSLADKEQGLADGYRDAVHAARSDQRHGAELASEGVLARLSSCNGMLCRLGCSGRSSTRRDLSASCWRRRSSAVKSPGFCISTRMARMPQSSCRSAPPGR